MDHLDFTDGWNRRAMYDGAPADPSSGSDPLAGRATVTVPAFRHEARHDGTSLLLGVGVGFNLTSALQLRLDLPTLGTDEDALKSFLSAPVGFWRHIIYTSALKY